MARRLKPVNGTYRGADGQRHRYYLDGAGRRRDWRSGRYIAVPKPPPHKPRYPRAKARVAADALAGALSRAGGGKVKARGRRSAEGGKTRDAWIETRARKGLKPDALAGALDQLSDAASRGAREIQSWERVQVVVKLRDPTTGETRYSSVSHAERGAVSLQDAAAALRRGTWGGDRRRDYRRFQVVAVDVRALGPVGPPKQKSPRKSRAK